MLKLSRRVLTATVLVAAAAPPATYATVNPEPPSYAAGSAPQNAIAPSAEAPSAEAFRWDDAGIGAAAALAIAGAGSGAVAFRRRRAGRPQPS